MEIRSRMCMSADGYMTTPDGWPAQLADPAFASGQSHRGAPHPQRARAPVLERRARAVQAGA